MTNERSSYLIVLFNHLDELVEGLTVILVAVFTANFVVFTDFMVLFTLVTMRVVVHNFFMISIPIPIAFSFAFVTTDFTLGRGRVFATTTHLTVLSNTLAQLTFVEAHLPEMRTWLRISELVLNLAARPSSFWNLGSS